MCCGSGSRIGLLNAAAPKGRHAQVGAEPGGGHDELPADAGAASGGVDDDVVDEPFAVVVD